MPSTVTRQDIATLAARLEAHAEILDDRPTVLADVTLAAGVLRHAVACGYPVGPITVPSDGLPEALRASHASG